MEGNLLKNEGCLKFFFSYFLLILKVFCTFDTHRNCDLILFYNSQWFPWESKQSTCKQMVSNIKESIGFRDPYEKRTSQNILTFCPMA